MNFADKLIRLRKKLGLSQEELAIKINVSRGVISKWESTQSIPDLDNIIQLSTLFNVSTDFLLKDELESEDFNQDEDLVRVLLLEEAKDYLSYEKKVALKTALGVMLCILSPVLLIVLSILSDNIPSFISSAMAVIFGMSALFVFVITAVILFITNTFSSDKYEYITKNNFNLEYGANSIIKEKKSNFKNIYNISILLGVILCILSPIALIISSFINNVYAITFSLLALFLIVSIAVFMFVFSSIRWSSFETVLLKEENKMKNNKKENLISRIIWLLATILYLSISFIFGYWHITWIIWVIAALAQVILIIVYKEE
jgi:transcriptional regulator with XRE-family HTH domain